MLNSFGHLSIQLAGSLEHHGQGGNQAESKEGRNRPEADEQQVAGKRNPAHHRHPLHQNRPDSAFSSECLSIKRIMVFINTQSIRLIVLFCDFRNMMKNLGFFAPKPFVSPPCLSLEYLPSHKFPVQYLFFRVLHWELHQLFLCAPSHQIAFCSSLNSIFLHFEPTTDQ